LRYVSPRRLGSPISDIGDSDGQAGGFEPVNDAPVTAGNPARKPSHRRYRARVAELSTHVGNRGVGAHSRVPTAARDPATDPEAIALRIHQIAATARVLAEVAVRLDDHGQSLSHALYLIEECLLDVQERVEELRHV
jgi:hypothetical protein